MEGFPAAGILWSRSRTDGRSVSGLFKIRGRLVLKLSGVQAAAWGSIFWLGVLGRSSISSDQD